MSDSEKGAKNLLKSLYSVCTIHMQFFFCFFVFFLLKSRSVDISPGPAYFQHKVEPSQRLIDRGFFFLFFFGFNFRWGLLAESIHLFIRPQKIHENIGRRKQLYPKFD